MKEARIAVVMLAVAAMAFAQQPSGQAGGSQSTPTQPNNAQTAPAPAPAPAGKRPPQAKTQPEYDAFNAAKAAGKDGASMEKAAEDFSAKFPDSELRVLLWEATLAAYQQSNEGDKMADAARKVLTLDPDQPDALLAVAEVLVERTRDTDLDKDQRYAEAQKDAEHALETIDTDISVPAGTPQQKVDEYKSFLRSSAYSIIGTVQFNQGKYPDAEASYKKSIDAFPSQPDAVVVLRLALALDKQDKYADALTQANRAVELTQENTTAGTYARRERDRLVQLTGGGASGTKPAPPSGVQTQPK